MEKAEKIEDDSLDITPCSLVEVTDFPEVNNAFNRAMNKPRSKSRVEVSESVGKGGLLEREYMALYPRRLLFSLYSPSREPKISRRNVYSLPF
jgi:hypothetical protein